ncbi:DUF3500 domain-containing protein [Nocardiopsis sp. NPDC050513]|uniref:DUF3500 domain-containing protein n=1 Tax=Nocardiopsis sp. NPDC050513 TaxID=3364338 RepID=UPI0037935949
MNTASKREGALRATAALALCVGLVATGCAASDDGADSGSAVSSGTLPESATGAGGANTAEVAAAANAFLDTLSDDQRDTVLHDFDDEAKTTGWSNLPAAAAERNGVALSDLDEEQRAAALAVMEAALSEQGYEELQGILAADDYLASVQGSEGGQAQGAPADGEDAPAGASPDAEDEGAPPEGAGGEGGPGGGAPGGGLGYGSDLYYLAFFGEPGESGQFMVQFGGHHAAYNITYAGDDVSLSPTLTAIEPMEFEYEGESYAPLEDTRTATMAAVASLDEDELAAAEISDSYDDLLLGPGNDGPYPEQPEGVLVSDLTQEQQDLVTAMLRTWVADLDEEAAESLMAKYVAEYDQTYLGWSEATTLDDERTYVRLDGPSAWVEFSNQGGIVLDGVHQHTIFRDETADYGWA